MKKNDQVLPTQRQWDQINRAVDNTVERHNVIIAQNDELRRRVDLMQNTIDTIVTCINIQCVRAKIEVQQTINPATPQALQERLAPAGGGQRSR
jgi:hypothetical protein